MLIDALYRRIFVYIFFCLINICLLLCDEANENKISDK